MVSGTKFYIFGGGRWREVDISDGRVEGWGRGKFAYAKRGEVRVAKTKTVLSALRDLGAGKNSAVKDGARLLHKKSEAVKKMDKKDQDSVCDHSHCCHSNTNRCIPCKTITQPPEKVSAETQCIAKVDAGIQTSIPAQTLIFPDSNKDHLRKRKRRIPSSDDDNIPTKIITTATVHTNSPKTHKLKIQAKRKRSTNTSSDENVIGSTKKKVPSLKLHKADSTKFNLYKRKRTKSSDSVVWVVLPKNQRSIVTHNDLNMVPEILKPTSKQTTKETLRSTSTPKQSNNVQNSKDRIEKLCATSKTNYEKQYVTQKSVTKSCAKNNVDTTSINSEKTTQNQEQCKELIIDEQDVELLRNYLLHDASDFDLLRFDQDDEYKKHFFFKINPLVNVERCPKIATMLRRDSQDEISLKDFASQLGLRSVSTKSSQPKRYRMRKLNNNRSYLDLTDSDTDKENSERHFRNRDRKNKYTNSNVQKVSKRYVDSESDTDSSEESVNNPVRRKSGRLEKLLKESDKKYDTVSSKRQKDHKDETTTIDSNTDNEDSDKPLNNNNNKISKLALKEVGKNSRKKEVITIQQTSSRQKNAIIFTGSEENNSVTENKLPKEARYKNKRKTGVLTDSNAETSEVEAHKSSKELKRSQKGDNNKKIRLDLTGTSGKNLEEALKLVKAKPKVFKTIVLTDSSEDETEISKPTKVPNRRGPNKIIENKRKNIDGVDSSEDYFETKVLKTLKEKINQTKVNNIKNSAKNRKDAEADSNDKNLKAEALKIKENNKIDQNKELVNKSKNKMFKDSHKDNNKINENKTNNKNNVNKRKTKDLTDSNEENSDEEVFRASKTDKRGENRVNNNKIDVNKRKTKDLTDSSNDTSEDETATSKDVNRKDQNKVNKNKAHKGKDFPKTGRENSENEKGMTSKDVKGKVSNTNSDKRKEDIDNRDKMYKAKDNIADAREISSGGEDEDIGKKSTSLKKSVTEGLKTIVAKSRHKISKRPSVSSSTFHTYSNLEDHAIVTWISSGGRANCVNGNRIWRELQDQFYSITGQTRSWHSLRNRYLRYILPALGTMALPEPQVARLRAAAATGEIKSRKRPWKRNSIFAPPSRGALSRRPGASRNTSTDSEPPLPPKRHKHDHTRKAMPTSPKRVLRSSLAVSPSPSRLSPRYSDITRHFAVTHQQDDSTPTVSPTPREFTRNSLATKDTSATKNLSASKNSEDTKLSKLVTAGPLSPARVTRQSLATASSPARSLSLRRSIRNRDSPAEESAKSPEKEKVRTRRLYNPGALL